MDDQNDQSTKPTKRASPPKSTGPGPAPERATSTRTSAKSKGAPKAAAPATTVSRRAPKAEATPSTKSKPTPTADASPTVSRVGPDAAADGAPSRDEMSIAFTPGQMAVGGAIVAGLLVFGVRLLLGRRRGRG